MKTARAYVGLSGDLTEYSMFQPATVTFSAQPILANPITEGFYVLLTGFPASQTVLQIEVNYCYEFVPSASAQTICVTDYPGQGQATLSAISNMV
jgi:hypothetical protein